MDADRNSKRSHSPEFTVMAAKRLPVLMTMVVAVNFGLLLDFGNVGPGTAAVSLVIAVVMAVAWYRLVTRPILALDDGIVTFAPKLLWPVRTVELAGVGEWRYANALLVLPTAQGNDWQGSIRLCDVDETRLEAALAERGLERRT